MPWGGCPFRYEVGDLAKRSEALCDQASPLLQVNAPITAMRPIRIKPQPNQRVIDGETPAKVWKNRLFAFHRRWNSNSDSVLVRWRTPSAIRRRPTGNRGSAAQFINHEDRARCHFHHVTISHGPRPPCPLYGHGTEMRASRSGSGDPAAVILRCLRSMSLRVGAIIQSPTRPKARPTR